MESRHLGLLMLLMGLVVPAAGCSGSADSVEPLIDRRRDPPELADPEFKHAFVDVTREAGIDFVHYNAATERRLLPETMGSGVAFFDFDGDNYPDLFFINGAPLGPSRDRPTSRLYRNLRNGRFADVTEGSGLDETYFGMGVAVGDFENDGRLDLAVTTTDGVRLYRNLGDGRFENVTRRMGMGCPGWGASLAFLDYDRDGYLDLFISRYIEWTVETDIPCSPDGVNPTYCTPEVYPGIGNCLYRSVDGVRFEDVSDEAGISQWLGKALGVVVLDYNDNGWPDVAVANDTVGNFLFVNQGDGTFKEFGVDSGMAYSESGAARGGMGIDAGDIDRDGAVDIVIGNFSQEMVAFFRSVESGYFIDDAAQVGIGLPTLMTLAFGTLVEDFDNDGWLDILVVNGHIEPEISVTRRAQAYRQAPQFFWNLGEGRFASLEGPVIGPVEKLLVGRGFASGDFNRNGALDFVVSQNGAEACLLRNESTGDNNWIQVKLEGTVSNSIGYGTRLRAIVGDTVITRHLVSGRSYMSASEPIFTVGLGGFTSVDRLELRWPSGIEQTVMNPPTNRFITVREPDPSR
jgi:enediyne biosynthesis protein E4